MARLEVQYVQEWFDKRLKKVRRRFRRPGYRSIELPGPPGSVEFGAAYQAAMESSTPRQQIGATKRSKPGTVNAALAGYYLSTLDFLALAPSTQAARRGLLERFRAETMGTSTSVGERMLRDLTPKVIQFYLRTLKPAVARNVRKALRHFLAYAVSMEIIDADPTRDIKVPSAKTTGFHNWTDDEITIYRARWPLGTQERLAFEIALNTALRCSDVIRLGPQHRRRNDDVIAIRQQKTGGEPLEIPIHSDLQAAIDATVCPHLTYLTDNGQPWGAKALSKAFSGWAREAGLLAGRTMHGLRKAACRRLAEASCSAMQIQAISGHADLKTLQIYVDAANKAKLAKQAIAAIDKPAVEDASAVKRTKRANKMSQHTNPEVSQRNKINELAR